MADSTAPETALDIFTVALEKPASPGAVQAVRGISVTSMEIVRDGDGKITKVRPDPTATDLPGLAENATFKSLIGNIGASAILDLKAEKAGRAADKKAAEAKIADLQPLADALPGEKTQDKLDGYAALAASVADLTAKLATAQATIRAGLLDFDAALDDLRQATALVNGYKDWQDVRDTRTDPGPWQAEAQAIVQHDNAVYAQSILDAEQAGTSPADWRRATAPWLYDGSPSKVEPMPEPAPADASDKPQEG